jgi:glycosyltransferase involved in cell wall biosynthesis
VSARHRPLDLAVMVYRVDTTGGMERQALLLARTLVARGANVTIVSTSPVPGWLLRHPPGVPLVERQGRLTIVRVPLSQSWKWVWCEWFYELAAAWILARRRRLDALYAVQWKAGIQASRVARFLDAPLFVKFAGGGVNGDFSVLGKSDDAERARAALATAEGLVCVSPQIAEEARAAGFADERLLRIPNGVELARIQGAPRAELPLPPDAEVVLFVGALRREKLLPDLVRSFAIVARARPKARLAIAGDGPEENAVRAAVREHGLDERVLLLGRRSDVPSLLKAASVLALTTESEGLSNSLLEALAAGTPIVTTDVEGNRALLGHEREALLVPLGDVEGFARAVVRLLEDRTLAAKLAAAGRAKAETYSIERVAQDYERAFARGARPRPSSLALAGRYLSFENPGVTGLLARIGRFLFGELVFHVKRPISAAVVALKQVLA